MAFKLVLVFADTPNLNLDIIAIGDLLHLPIANPSHSISRGEHLVIMSHRDNCRAHFLLQALHIIDDLLTGIAIVLPQSWAC